MFLSSKKLYRGCCVYLRPTLEGQNVLPRFDHRSGRGMGITTSCRMQGIHGSRQSPCQHREVPCPVPARIMDWEISGRGSTIQPPGYSFPPREVNCILLLGMSATPAPRTSDTGASSPCRTDKQYSVRKVVSPYRHLDTSNLSCFYLPRNCTEVAVCTSDPPWKARMFFPDSIPQ
jgi:hypothetical protein